MYLQNVQKSRLSPFDDKGCYIDEIESTPLVRNWEFRLYVLFIYSYQMLSIDISF